MIVFSAGCVGRAHATFENGMRKSLVLLVLVLSLHGLVTGQQPKHKIINAVVGRPSDGEWNVAYRELWEILLASLNITLNVRELDTWLPEASWEDLLNEIRNNSAQISLTPITMLPSTAVNITFSTPVHRTSLSVLVRISASEGVRWSSFFEPFRRSLWLAILSSVVLLSFVLAVLWWLERGSSYMSSFPCSLPELQLSEALICVIGASCLQGHPTPPLSISARIVHLISLISAVVVIAVYSSSVTAFLAVTRDLRPFSSLDQLLINSRFRPITLYGSPEHEIFQDSEHISLLQHRQAGPPTTLGSLNQALAVTCGRNTSLLGSFSRKVPAFVISSLWADRALALAPCPLLHIPLTGGQSLWAAFPLTQKLPYTKIINTRLRRLIGAGTIAKYSEYITLKKQLALERKFAEKTSHSEHRFIVTLKDVAPLLALLGIGASVSLIILAVECILHYLSNRSKPYKT